MNLLSRLLIPVVLLLAVAPHVHAQDKTMQFRYMSHVIRDHAPTVAEAREFYDGTKALDAFVQEWLQSAQHRQRVQRHFQDIFGTNPYPFVAQEEYDLILENGVYRLNTSIKPSCGGAPIQRDAWWSDQPISICPSAVSDELSFTYNSTPLQCSRLSNQGLYHPACGCGREQILCFPKQLKPKIMAAIATEFKDRALYAYEQNKSWNELFGSQMFFGNRWLFHYYLYQNKIMAMSVLPSPQEMAYLKSLPIDQKVQAVNPGGAAARSGVATSPGFLKQFNNFRSRTRAITERLLCRDIDPTLNTSGISSFVNPSLSAFDRAHGAQANCAGCHYAMDNIGSPLLGWDDNGFFQSWNPPSTLGHAFGQDVTNPDSMLQAYVDHGPGFDECMAKTTWEGFSGMAWGALSEESKVDFTNTAANGPRELIRKILLSSEMQSMRVLKSSTTVTKVVQTRYDFARDINPVLLGSCAGSSCHSSGTSLGSAFGFVGNESRFRNTAVQRLLDGSMPPAGSGRAISDSDRQKLIQFRQQGP